MVCFTRLYSIPQDPLEHTHLGETLETEGVELEVRGEVGLLTRNVVVRGSNNKEWHDFIEACPDGFDTGRLYYYY